MKKLFKTLLTILVAISLFACGNGAETKLSTNSTQLEEVRGVTIPEFSITINDKTVTNQDLAEYPIYKSQVTSVNSSGTESTVNFIGFKFVDALEFIGFPLDVKYVEAVADDGYSVKYENRDVNYMLIAISKDGSQFKKNPWFCPCDSDVTGEFLQGLTTILVNNKNEKPNLNVTEKVDEQDSKTLSKPDKSDKTDKVTFGEYKFKVSGVDVTNSDLDGLNIYKISCDALNSKDAVINSTYTGYVLKDVLNKLGFSNISKVKAVADDGYSVDMTSEQINSEYTLIAIEKDKEVGKNGTVWLAPCEEDKTKKYISNVIEIIVE